MNNGSIALLKRFATGEESKNDLEDLRARTRAFLEEIEKNEAPSDRKKEYLGRALASHLLKIKKSPGRVKRGDIIDKAAAESVVKLMDDEGFTYKEACQIVGEAFGMNSRDVGGVYSNFGIDIRSRDWLRICGRADFSKAVNSVRMLQEGVIRTDRLEIDITGVYGNTVMLFNEVRTESEVNQYRIQKIKINALNPESIKNLHFDSSVITKLLSKKARANDVSLLVDTMTHMFNCLMYSNEVQAVDSRGAVCDFRFPDIDMISSLEVAVIVFFFNEIQRVNNSREKSHQIE